MHLLSSCFFAIGHDLFGVHRSRSLPCCVSSQMFDCRTCRWLHVQYVPKKQRKLEVLQKISHQRKMPSMAEIQVRPPRPHLILEGSQSLALSVCPRSLDDGSGSCLPSLLRTPSSCLPLLLPPRRATSTAARSHLQSCDLRTSEGRQSAHTHAVLPCPCRVVRLLSAETTRRRGATSQGDGGHGRPPVTTKPHG